MCFNVINVSNYIVFLGLFSTQKEWLCLNCQTQRALQVELDDGGKTAQRSPASSKKETQVTPTDKRPEPKTVPSSRDKTPIPTKLQPVPGSTKAVTTAVPTLKENVDFPKATTEAMDKTALPATAEKMTAEVEIKPSEALEVKQADIPKDLAVADKVETTKTDEDLTPNSKTDETKPFISVGQKKDGVVPIEASSSSMTDSKVAPSLSRAQPELSAHEEIREELKHDDIKMPAETKSFQQVRPQQETKAVPEPESQDVASTIVGTSILEAELTTKDMKRKVSNFSCKRQTAKRNLAIDIIHKCSIYLLNTLVYRN